MLEKLLDLFFPKKCVFCNEKIYERYTCRKCLNIIEYYKERVEIPNDAYYDKLICAIKYNGILRRKMLKFKFDDAKYFSKGFAEILYEKMLKYSIEADLIVPVPISFKRLYERGYNQSELLTRYLSKFANIESDNNILIKYKNNATQSKLGENERVDNVKDVYDVKNPYRVSGKRVILVDDICTTGATVNACAKVLKEAGATDVFVLTVMYSILKRKTS